MVIWLFFSTFVGMKNKKELKAQEETAFREKAANYLVCFIDHCPLHEECLRWQAGHYVSSSPYAQKSVNPHHAGVATEQCPLFRKKERIVLKRGLTRLYLDMPSRVEYAVRQQLYQEFGRKYYFEMRKGDRPITPEQQQVILDTCRHFGWQGPIVYDSEEEGFAW